MVTSWFPEDSLAAIGRAGRIATSSVSVAQAAATLVSTVRGLQAGL